MSRPRELSAEALEELRKQALRLLSEPEGILTSGEVGVLFRVDAKTVVRWANEGKLSGFRTPGGRWLFRADQVRQFTVEKGAVL